MNALTEEHMTDFLSHSAIPHWRRFVIMYATFNSSVGKEDNCRKKIRDNEQTWHDMRPGVRKPLADNLATDY